MPSVCLQCFDAVGWVAGRGMTKYRKGPQRTAKDPPTVQFVDDIPGGPEKRPELSHGVMQHSR